MSKYFVAITKYDPKGDSVRNAIDLSNALANLKGNDKVFIKPNIVVWTSATVFPKWGTLTTSRVIEDVVIILKEMGIDDITIGETINTTDPKDKETARHAFETLGYDKLKERYGVKSINLFERPFEKVDLGEGVELSCSTELINSDFVINIPVLKTHAQAVVSLATKNLKGAINSASRKKCHSADPERDLDFMISRLPKMLPASATIIDGIYSLEKGPAPDGKARRSNIIIASSDILSADMVGAKVLGHDPMKVPHLVHSAKDAKRPVDLSDIEVLGERIEDVASYHEYDFPYNEDGTLHMKMEKMGIKGLTYRKYDNSMCTYCSAINGLVLSSVMMAWKGEPWDDVEILTGKRMQPTPGKNKTILLGQCMYKLHKDNPAIKEMIPIKGCPPKPMDAVSALHKAGIMVNADMFKNTRALLGYFMGKYENKPEFEESFFVVE
jgi:uncharacterized protein (DUF362 family)